MLPRDQVRRPEHDVEPAQPRAAHADALDEAADDADQRTAASTSLGQFDLAFGGAAPAVQRKADAGAAVTAETAGIHAAAAAGVDGAAGPLPHLDAIQRSFGRHDVTGIGAHTGDAAATSAASIGARAYAIGDQVAFRGAPDLHTSAHEAAHVVQQRQGVSLKGGVDQGHDAHEQHADAVADLVVSGKSAEAALDAAPGGGGGQAVQRDGEEEMVTRGGREYVIQRGDNLSSIARRIYGNARHWRDIMRANPDEVRDGGNLIYAGHTLHLPLLQVAQSTAPAIGLDDLGLDPEAPTTPAVCEPDAALGPVDECVGRDYRAVFRDLNQLVPAERDQIMLEIRERGEWEDFLAALDDSHVATVQSWMTPETGQDGDLSLEERISHAHNSSRGQAALAAVDSLASVDINVPPRITERIREMLALGVALPALEGNDLASEGVLTVTSATRAAEALIAMPTTEYLRITMQLTLAGGPSEWLQQFNLLKAVAARRDQFLDAESGNDSLAELETFADSIREMSEEDLVRQTNVIQTDPAELGLVQKFTMSCNVTSGVVVRAQADPVEALRMHQNGELAIDALGGSVAGETEQCLESHGGNVAVARDPSTTQADVNAAIVVLSATAPADELLAVSNYMNNLAYDGAKYASGIALVRAHLARDGYPNDQAMRIVRETAGGGPQPGLDPDELATEFNGALGVTAVTGQTAAVDFDDTLWGLYTADNDGDGNPDRTIPTPVPSTWTTLISGLLSRARPQIEAGEDVTFNVYWHGGGGHTMTFTNVRDEGGVAYLVHDTWTGNTTWVTEADILQCNWPGGQRGVLAGVIG